MDDAAELLTLTEAAAYLGLGTSTLYAYAQCGAIPPSLFRTLGRRRVISRRQLIRWLEEPVEATAGVEIAIDFDDDGRSASYASISHRLGV